MRDYKILLISFVLLIFMIGAVSAGDVNSSDNAIAVSDDGDSLGAQLIPIIDPINPVDPGDDDPGDVEVDTKDLYVSDTGDDDNSGSAESPYATISKAYSEVNASNDATIHIGEGTFFLEGTTVHYYEDYGDGDFEEWDEVYNGLYINLDHKTFGGNLKFIGAGADKTFLDGQSAFNFATINPNANVLIKDVTFINCKSYNGGTIDNRGNLTVENCIFKDSYATGSQGGAIASTGSGGGMIIIGGPTTGGTYLTVKNSQFISTSVNGYQQWGWDPQGGGAIFANNINELYLENNTFINNRIASQGENGVAVYSVQSKTYLINNKFINLTGSNDGAIFINPADDGSKQSVITGNQFINCSCTSDSLSIACLRYGYHKFENNTFINSSNAAGNIYADGYVETLNFEIDDEVITISNAEINNGVKIPVNVTDDMGNIVTTNSFSILLTNENNSYYPSSGVSEGMVSITFNEVPKNGIYNLSIEYNGGKSTTDVLTTVNVSTSNDPIDLYVSENGSDADEGTQDSPFATIQHAIDVGFEKSFTVIVHLLKGRFYGEGNVGLTIANKGTLQIIGEAYNETIIDGENSNWFMNVRTTDVTVENLKFINGESSRTLITGNYILNLKDCIVDSNKAQSYVMESVLFDNLVYTNNDGSIYMSWNPYDSIIISDSYFANNNCTGSYGVLVSPSNNRDVTVENCKFINNSAVQPGAALNGIFKSKNNYFEGNTAPNSAVIYVQGDGCSFENDTFINNRVSGNYGVLGTTYELIFNDCRFINNSAIRGGALGLTKAKITNASFINNTADYGGAILLVPVVDMPRRPANAGIELEDVTFEDNIAKINGKDIYFDEAPNTGQTYKNDLIPLSIVFNDLNVSSLVDTLTVDVIGPCGAIVGGGSIDFVLNDTKIATIEIVNSVASFNYAGFEDGIFTFSGNTVNANENSTFTNGTITVKLENILDKVEFWVSPEGSDEDGNGSESNPFKSISYAVDKATKNCRNIDIHIAEGIYTGDLNTALELSAMNNLTLIGSGVDKTIIDGENTTYFATIPAGNNRVTVSNLTIRNMLPDNRVSRAISDLSPITIIEGANLLLDTVAIVDNHGGNAIIVNGGNLVINNSEFKRNGFAQIAIICGGNDEYGDINMGSNVNIDNTLFEDNYVYKSNGHLTIITAENLVINNSEIKNGYIFSDTENSVGFALINFESNSQDNVTIENTNISNDGSIDALNELGVNTDGKLVNPALDVNGNIYMNNCSMVNNFNGTLNTANQVASITYASAFGYSYVVDRNVNVYNTSIINYQYLWMATSNNVHNFVLDGCVFENLEYIAYIRTNNPDSNYNITNSVFLNCTNIINQNHYAPMATPQHVNLNDNYWGNNSKPVVYFLDNGRIKDDIVEPDTWIVLFSEDEKAIIKNVTDGENSTNYTGVAPIREGYADDNGALGYAVVFGPVGYLFTTDDDHNVIFDENAAIYPFEDVDPMNYRDNAIMDINKINGSGAVFGSIFDVMGNPVANATVVYTLDGVEANTTTDENGSFVVFGGNGDLNITFVGDDMYFPIEKVITLENIAPVKTDTKFDLAVDGNLVISGILSDVTGKALANTPFTYIVNGSEVNATTDANGAFTIEGVNNGTVEITFIGDDSYLATSTSLKLDNIAPTRIATVIESDYTFTRQANDYSAGERGDFFYATLKDINGNPIANVTCYVAVNGPIYNVTTDENGKFGVQVNLAAANTYTYALSFLGNEKYEASLNCSKLVLTAKKTTITAKAKAFKAKAKTKTISVTLSTVKNPYDGKTYLKAGKKLTMKLNGKTYTAKINAKGVAKFTIKLTKKGKYSAKITFAGDKTYKASSKTIKVTIK